MALLGIVMIILGYFSQLNGRWILLSSVAMEADLQQPVVAAAGVIARSPSGKILMVRRTDDGTWAFPGGKLKDGETSEQAAYREFWEECGYRLGSVGGQLVKDGVDYTTFLAPVESEFVPILNHEASSFGWFDCDLLLAENRADSADEPSIPPPLYPVADQEEGLEDPVDDPEDDLDDELADLILAELEALDVRLQKIEDCGAADSNEPVQGNEGAAELEHALEEGVRD